jgi:hypothetical protein
VLRWSLRGSVVPTRSIAKEQAQPNEHRKRANAAQARANRARHRIALLENQARRTLHSKADPVMLPGFSLLRVEHVTPRQSLKITLIGAFRDRLVLPTFVIRIMDVRGLALTVTWLWRGPS